MVNALGVHSDNDIAGAQCFTGWRKLIDVGDQPAVVLLDHAYPAKVDDGIVMVENAYRHISEAQTEKLKSSNKT